MRCRALRIAMLCFVILWFEVLLPAHTRGQIVLAGSEPASRSCCGNLGATKNCASLPDGRKQQPLRSRGQCAVCHFIATLDLPPSVMLDVPGMTRRIESAQPSPRAKPTLAPRYTFPERGPPAA